jgi:hypothetical protein
MRKSFEFTIAKAIPEKRIVAGWCSVVAEGPMGKRNLVVDRQNDAIDIDALSDAVHDWVKSGKHHGGDMHVRKGTSKLVGSLVLDDDVQKALQIDCGRTGWFAMFELDPETFAKVKAGERIGFSIAGSAVREPLET